MIKSIIMWVVGAKKKNETLETLGIWWFIFHFCAFVAMGIGCTLLYGWLTGWTFNADDILPNIIQSIVQYMQEVFA